MARLVLADDNLTTQRMVELSLEMEGYDVVAFRDGSKALDYVLGHDVDILLANVSLPGLNGYELASLLADEPDKSSLPVVLIVGALGELDEEAVKKSRCSDVLKKPFSTSGLLDLITRVREQVSAEPAAVTNLFDVPLGASDAGAEQELLFQLTPAQARSSERTLLHEHIRPSVNDLAAVAASQRLDTIARELSERLPRELSAIIPGLTEKLCRELNRD